MIGAVLVVVQAFSHVCAGQDVSTDGVRGYPRAGPRKLPRARTFSGQGRRAERHTTSFSQISGRVEGQAVAVCKTVGSAYVGSNPTPATTCENGPLAAETRPGGPFPSRHVMYQGASPWVDMAQWLRTYGVQLPAGRRGAQNRSLCGLGSSAVVKAPVSMRQPGDSGPRMRRAVGASKCQRCALGMVGTRGVRGLKLAEVVAPMPVRDN